MKGLPDPRSKAWDGKCRGTPMFRQKSEKEWLSDWDAEVRERETKAQEDAVRAKWKEKKS